MWYQYGWKVLFLKWSRIKSFALPCITTNRAADSDFSIVWSMDNSSWGPTMFRTACRLSSGPSSLRRNDPFDGALALQPVSDKDFVPRLCRKSKCS